MSSAVSKPLQSSGERMQGYACLAAAMALVGSTVVASKIIAAGLPFHRHRAALRAGAALLPPDHETDRRVPAPTRRARLGVADGAGRRGSVGYGAAHHRPAARLGGGRRHHPGRIAAGVRRPGRDAAGRTARPRHAGRDRDRHGGRMADDGQPAGPEGASSLAGNALVLGAVCCEGLFILLHKRLRAGAAARAVDHHDRHRPGRLGAGEPAGRGALDAGAARRRGAGRGLLRAGAHGGRLPAGTRAPAAMARKPRCSPVAPVCAVLLAAGLLGEALRTRQLAGMVCVLAAIALLGLSNRASARAR